MLNVYKNQLIPLVPEGGGGDTVLPLSICPSFRPSKIFFIAFFSVTVDGRNLIFGHKLHIGSPYGGKRCSTHQIPTSCLPPNIRFLPSTVTEKNATKIILDRRKDGRTEGRTDGRTVVKQYTPSPYIGSPYGGKRCSTHQIPTSCLPTLLICMHIFSSHFYQQLLMAEI
jgi:hypothetical protein